MRDESVVVAGELTGKLNHKCFYCTSRHLTKNAIKRCAYSFVKDVFGQPTISTRCRLKTLNLVDMAKRGLMARAIEYQSLVSQAYFCQNWTPNWQHFVMCENTTEAYEVAKQKLGEWRDQTFLEYNAATIARNKCLTEFTDLLAPSTAGFLNPVHVNATKTPGPPVELEIDGHPVPLYEVASFYRNHVSDLRDLGTIIDADLNRNMILWERGGLVYQRASTANTHYLLTKIGHRGKATTVTLKITKPVPIESL